MRSLLDPPSVRSGRRIARRALLAWAAAAAVAARADAPQRSCTLPGAGWRELRSKHFVVDVADPRSDPAQLVGSLEELRAAVLAALVADPVEVPGRMRVVVLASRERVEEIGGRKEGPYYLTNVADPAVLGASGLGEPALLWWSGLGEPVLLVASEDLESRPQAIAHALAHHLSRYLFPRQPWWFAEGLAQFVESVGTPDRQGRRWAGADPTSGQAGVVKLTPLVNLMSGATLGWFNDPYLTSWILYRYLWNEQGQRLAEYQRRLSDGAAPHEAWRATFPEWDPGTGSLRRLGDVLAHHQRSGRGVRWEVKVAGVDRSFGAAAASTADLHMLLLEPRIRSANDLLKRSLRRDSAQEALREEPGHPIASAVLASVEGTSALDAARVAVAAHDADGRAWYLLARAATDPVEREAALLSATRLWPESALAHAALAVRLASTGRARQALPFANEALDLAPWSPDAMAALARVAVELGQCQQALQLQTRAAESAEAGTIGPVEAQASELRRQLGEFRSRCDSAKASREVPPAQKGRDAER